LLTPKRFAAALLLGLVVRVATLPLPGHSDIILWKIWSYAAAHDVLSMYGVGGTPTTRGLVAWGDQTAAVDYPPFFLYEYAIVGRVFGALFPSYPDGTALLVAVKLPALLANIALTAVFYAVVRRASGRQDAAQWAALAYWLNPATMFGGELLGYLDALYFLPAIAGIALAYFDRPWWAGVLVAVAVGTKPQGLLVGPAFALALWQSGRVRAIASAAVTFCVTLALIAFPFYLKGALANMWLAFGSFDERRDTMSAYAANIGWIVNWWLRGHFAVHEFGFPQSYLQFVPRPLAISRFRELGYPNPRPIGRLAIVAATGWALWTTRRTRDLTFAAALGAFTVHAFFVLGTGMHEHHQLLEIPLLVLAAALNRRFRPLLVVVSGIVALNINYIYGIGIDMGWMVPRMITGIDLSVLLSFFNVGVLIWFARRLHDEASRTAVA
jgi:hypothetical protein